MNKESIKKFKIVGIYAIAMAFLETAVVIYLRKLYYPSGFTFPLKGFIDPSILSVEWIREAATIIMLITIGMLAGKKIYEKQAYFLYAFGVWDIFYYVFLKLYLDWPASFLTWDLLFLIPWPWTGPVIAPVIWAGLMIVAAVIEINAGDKGKKISIIAREWILIIIGSVLVLYTWLYDYGKIIFSGDFAKDFFSLASNDQFTTEIGKFVPTDYNWIVFIIGTALAISAIVSFYIRNRKR